MTISHHERTKTSVRTREAIALMVARESGLYASPRAFWRLCVANPDLRLERTANGEVIVMAPAGFDSGIRNASLTAQLWNWNKETGLGVISDSSGGFTLPNSAVKAADAAWIALERWLAVPAGDQKKFAPVCPDFVVEITSPTDTLKRTRKKMREYLAQGVRLGWLLDPKSGLAEIYRPGHPAESLHRPATLSGEDVLPGFVLELRGILFD
jgi:Uma2 family endonuclease